MKKPSYQDMYRYNYEVAMRKRNLKRMNKFLSRFFVMAAILLPLIMSFLIVGSAINRGEDVAATVWFIIGVVGIIGLCSLSEEGYWK